MLDHHALLAYEIPSVTQHLTPYDTVFYALSCGLGADPVDQAQLDYVDFHRALRVLPSMPVVMCYDLDLLTRPEFGIDAVKIVHGEEHVALHAELPVRATLTGTARITQLVDKGPGRGALLVLERLITDTSNGILLATVTSTIFLRGDGGFSGDIGPVLPEISAVSVSPVPLGPPDVVIELPTRPEQALYYRLNGDENPLHADPEFAARAGFPRPILHGLCTFGVVTHALLRGLGQYQPGALADIGCRFSSPVFPGESITTEIWANGAFRARVAARDVVVVSNGFARFA
ncbi:MAG: MaoC/PaaZ C-terminal domain-containing protein [Acidocella sp.]|nr:MaoC/PaaZ C-terminal domain-containing protein [Acidocella sp.]